MPSSATSGKRLPLVLNLHGSGSDARGQEAFSGMDTTADAHGFIVAYPQALIRDGTGFDWNVPGVPLIGGRAVPAGSANDVTFIASLVPLLSRSYCIEPGHVYSTGMSGGARMTSQLGCDTSGIFAAIAPVSGLRYPSPCSTPAAVPVVAFHGNADPVDPFDGHGQKYWTYSVPDAASRWATHNGCDPKRKHQTATIIEYTKCRGGSQVVLHIVVGEGHEWPGGPRMPEALTNAAGPQSNAISANDTMWSFFSHYSLPQS
ncbi:MAG TPA: PHB depolymerase family esterase [Acidimicrobiia bacterium]